MKKETICVQGAYEPKSGDPRVLPLYQSTTYYYESLEEMAHLFDVPKDGHIYSRISNPTVACYEQKVAMLEGGTAAMAVSSGMAATLVTVLNVCNAGDNIVANATIYGGTFNLFKTTLPKYGIGCRFVSDDMTDEEIKANIDDKTKLFFAETIANPAMVVFDFDRFSKICKEEKLLLCIDNTLATPILVKPFLHGANIVVHSTTKYMDGHATAVGGIIVDGGNFEYRNNPRYVDFVTPDESYHGINYVDEGEGGKYSFVLKARMQGMRDFGTSMSPFNAYITNLGMETLHLRMERHSSNALALAKALEKHPMVSWVKYAGLESDKYHERALKYFNGGFSGMVVFGIKGGRANAEKFITNLHLFKNVTHIADVRSCVLHPASTTHRQLSSEDLKKAGIDEGLVRLSVGIENECDVVSDIIGALDSIK